MLGAAVTEAVDMGHNYIGTEHLLLAFFGQPESLGTQVLVGLGASQDVVRAEVIEALAGFGKKL
jgi:ATP-dependent Clp protease ATP-binding subunit ClpA